MGKPRLRARDTRQRCRQAGILYRTPPSSSKFFTDSPNIHLPPAITSGNASNFRTLQDIPSFPIFNDNSCLSHDDRSCGVSCCESEMLSVDLCRLQSFASGVFSKGRDKVSIGYNRIVKASLAPNVTNKQRAIFQRGLREMGFGENRVHTFLKDVNLECGSKLLLVCLVCAGPLENDACCNSNCTAFKAFIRPSMQARIIILNIVDQVAMILQRCFEPSELPNEIVLDVSTDGAPIAKKGNLSIWPLSMSIRNLTIFHRFTRVNMIIAALWQCRKKPPSFAHWEVFAGAALRKAMGTHKIKFSNHEVRIISIKLGVLTGDLPAISSVLNKSNCNSLVGACTFCKIVGVRKHNTQIYPYQPGVEIRYAADWARCIEEAEATGDRVLGIKGRNIFSSNSYLEVPDDVAVDYFHGILHGVQQRLLNFWQRNMSRASAIALNGLIDSIELPRDLSGCELVSFNNPIWKGKHEKVFFLLAPILLFEILPVEQYLHSLLMYFSVRLLVSPHITFDSPTNRRHIAETARNFINLFQKYNAKLYGSSFETINVHNSGHLPDIYEKHGPLCQFSTFAFEGLYGSLVESFTGTRYQIDQMAGHFIKEKIIAIYESSNLKNSRIPYSIRQFVSLKFPQQDVKFISSTKTKHVGHIYGEIKGGGVAGRCPKSILVKTSDGRVVQVVALVETSEKVVVIAKEYKITRDEVIIEMIKSCSQKNCHTRAMRNALISQLNNPHFYNILKGFVEYQKLAHDEVVLVSTDDIIAKIISVKNPDNPNTYYAIDWLKEEDLN